MIHPIKSITTNLKSNFFYIFLYYYDLLTRKDKAYSKAAERSCLLQTLVIPLLPEDFTGFTITG